MSVLLDHVFVCTAAEAPEADTLRRFGLTEGPPNRHPGQGTACRRFFFQNFMLELIWVADAGEAQSEQTRRTQLFERWSAAGRGASPFGIILRPGSSGLEPCPFASWEYCPAAMPDLALRIAAETSLEEPMWCYLAGDANSAAQSKRPAPAEHSVGFREVTGVRLVSPPLPESSVTRAMVNAKVIALETGTGHSLTLQFDGGRAGREIDFRPVLPVIFRW